MFRPLSRVLNIKFAYVSLYGVCTGVACILAIYLTQHKVNDAIKTSLTENTQSNTNFMLAQGMGVASQTFDIQLQRVEFVNQWKVDEFRKDYPYLPMNASLSWMDDQPLSNGQRLYPDQPLPYVTFDHGSLHVLGRTSHDIQNFSKALTTLIEKSFLADPYYKNRWVVSEHATTVSIYSCYASSRLSVEYPGTQISLTPAQIAYDCSTDDWYLFFSTGDSGMTTSYTDPYALTSMVSIIATATEASTGVDVRLQNLPALFSSLVSLGTFDDYLSLNIYVQTDDGWMTLKDRVLVSGPPDTALNMSGVAQHIIRVDAVVDPSLTTLFMSDIEHRATTNVNNAIIILICVIVCAMTALLTVVWSKKQQCLKGMGELSRQMRYVPENCMGILPQDAKQSMEIPRQNLTANSSSMTALAECYDLATLMNDKVIPSYNATRALHVRTSTHAPPQYVSLEIDGDGKKPQSITKPISILDMGRWINGCLWMVVLTVLLVTFLLSSRTYDTNTADMKTVLWANAQTTLMLSTESIAQGIQLHLNTVATTAKEIADFASGIRSMVNTSVIPPYSALSNQENYQEAPKDANGLSLYAYQFCLAAVASKELLVQTPGVQETTHMVYPFRALLHAFPIMSQGYIGFSNGVIMWVQADQTFADDYRDNTFLDTRTNTYRQGYSPVYDPWFNDGLRKTRGFTVPYWDSSERVLTITHYIAVNIVPGLDSVMGFDLLMTSLTDMINQSNSTPNSVSFLYDPVTSNIMVHPDVDPSQSTSTKLSIVEPEIAAWLASGSSNSNNVTTSNSTSTVMQRNSVSVAVGCRPVRLVTGETFVFCKVLPQDDVFEQAMEEVTSTWDSSFKTSTAVVTVLIVVFGLLLSCNYYGFATEASRALHDSYSVLETAVVCQSDPTLQQQLQLKELPTDECLEFYALAIDAHILSTAIMTNVATSQIASSTAQNWRVLQSIFNHQFTRACDILTRNKNGTMPALSISLERGCQRVAIVNGQQWIWMAIKHGVRVDLPKFLLDRLPMLVNGIANSLYRNDDYRILGDSYKAAGALAKAQNDTKQAEQYWDQALRYYVEIQPETHPERVKAAFGVAVQLSSLALIAKLSRAEIEKRLEQASTFYRFVQGTAVNKEYQLVLKMNYIWFRLDYNVDLALVANDFHELEAQQQQMSPNLVVALRQLKKKFLKRTLKTRQRILIMSDVSGSMQGDKFVGMQTGMKMLIHNLDRPFTLTIETFSNEITNRLAAMEIKSADHIAEAESVVDKIPVGGGTDLYGAMLRCMETVRGWTDVSLVHPAPPIYDAKDAKDDKKDEKHSVFEDFVFLITDGYQFTPDENHPAYAGAQALIQSQIRAIESHPIYFSKPNSVTWRYYTVRAQGDKPNNPTERISAQNLPNWFSQLGGQTKDIVLNPNDLRASVRSAFQDMQDVLQNNDIIDCGLL